MSATARDRLEAFVQENPRKAEHFAYQRESERGGGPVWTVTVEWKRPPLSRIAIIAAALSLENACADAIKGLADLGVEVP